MRKREVDEEKTHIVNRQELVLGTRHVGDLHVVGGGRDILELLAGEDLAVSWSPANAVHVGPAGFG